MENKTLRLAFSRAITVLGAISKDEIQQLSLLDCAYMLTALPDMDSLASTRQWLAERLRARVNTSWIEGSDAYEVYSALSALWRYNSACVAGEWLAGAIGRLLQSEVQPGGPYYTDNMIAVAANAQIGIFISQVAQPLPNVNRLLANVIALERFDNTKLTSFGLLYLLARACDGDKLRQYARNNWQHNDDWQTPWHKVVGLVILKDSVQRSKIEQTLLAVCQQQHPSGFWGAEPLVKDVPQDQCSRLVTTALIVEALCNYLYPPAKDSPGAWQQSRQIVARAATEIFSMHSEPLRSSALAAVNRVCAADENFEITLLPQFFGHALNVSEHCNNAYYTKLGLANVYMWTAYTIYDDFMDDEGVPAELPVANLAMRASLDCFRAALPDDAHFQRYVGAVFARMDEANAWEINHCRFAVQGKKITIAELPKYGQCTVLAARAFAHALTPMAVLAHSPKGAKQPRHHIEIAFQHYLIARQLNDDLHDWVKDMQAGQASYVVTAILRDMRVKYGVYNLDTLLPTMKRCFRRTTMPKVCQRMLWHIDVSRQHFAKSQLLQATNDIYLLLDSLELSAQQSLDKRAKSQALASISAI
jgi:hypothetical protein